MKNEYLGILYMECKLPIKDFEIRIDRRGRKKAKIMGKKENLPDELQIGEAWKVFGKWMVAIGESDQNEVNIPNYGTRSGHVCIVLRGLGFTLYFYELIDDYTKEQYKAFDHIRLLLDRVLVTNQAASARLRNFLEKVDKHKGVLFPNFFTNFDQKKIAEWSEDIDAEIEKWSNTPFEFQNLNRGKYINSICNPTPESLKWDVKGCYEQLLSAFNTLRPTLPEENIQIIDELILRCEHGYFLGYLIDKTIKEYEKDHPKIGKQKAGIRTTTFLTRRVDRYRKTREKKVKLAAQEAFGLTPEVQEKLDRMFEFEEERVINEKDNT